MSRILLFLSGLAAGVALLASSGHPGPATSAPPAKPPAGRHALLVGCTRYDNQPRFTLESAPNDIRLLRRVLARRGFPDAGITELSEEQARLSRDDRSRPTRANIERAFRDLAGRVHEDDQVVIWLSGHGSRQPEGKLPAGVRPKPGGWRQTFLPCDIGDWDGKAQTVEKAVIDYELRGWLEGLTRRGAFVWVIVDACHSGSVCRQGPRERSKEIPPQQLKVPAGAAAAAKAPPLGLAEDARLAAIYACEPEDITYEVRLPSDQPDAEWHGLLTYTLCQELEQASRPLSYAGLVQNIRARYIAEARYRPRPLVEFGGKDREVLGSARLVSSPFLLRRDEGSWSVNGGAVHGLTEASVLEVRPPAGRGEEVVGHVRVKAAGALKAEVEPCTADGKADPKAGKLSDNGRCRPVFLDLGQLRLRVAAVAAIHVSAKVAPAGREAERTRPAKVLDALAGRVRELEGQLQDLAKEKGAAVTAVADPSQADWLLCSDGAEVFLLRGGGLARELLGPPVGSWLLRGAGREGATWWLPDDPTGRPLLKLPPGKDGPVALKETSGRIARAQLLCQVAARSATELAGSDLNPEETDFLVEVAFRQPAKPGKRQPEIDPVRNPPPAGATLACDIINHSQKTRIVVTALHIDSDFRITLLYPPKSGVIAKLDPEQKVPGVEVPVGRGKAPGPEYLIVLAVKPGEDLPDFTWLAGPDPGNGATREAKAALKSPLGELFRHALFHRGGARGLPVTTRGEYLALVRSWVPAPAAKR